MNKRPTSPHLSIYKWQITSVISILHRFTHIYLYFLTLVVAIILGIGFSNTTKEISGFLPMIAFIKGTFNCCIISKILWGLFIFGSIFAIVFNILAGFRYFIWSFVIGFNLRFVTISGYFIILFSLASSLIGTKCLIDFILRL